MKHTPVRVTRWERQVAVRLAVDQHRHLRALARRRRQPLSELIRSALDAVLRAETSAT